MGLDVVGGRFPLSVEAHLMAMTARLVPGATTVTTNARYYSLHGLVAVEAEERGLDSAEMTVLLRRCEVVFGAAAIVNGTQGGPAPHGSGPLGAALDSGELDVDRLSTPRSGYSNSARGFWGQYLGSEITLGILDPTDPSRPGPRSDRRALREGLEGLIDLASRPTVSVDALRERPHLTLDCREAADGQWLRSLFVEPPTAVEALAGTDRARRATIDLLTAALASQPAASFSEAMRQFVGFSDSALNHADTSEFPEAEAWRGVLLRWYSVGAWRRLWKWLVDQLEGRVVATDELAAECAALFPDELVRDFLGGLPPIESGGVPLRAEEQVRAEDVPLPVRELAVLLVGGLRTAVLEGTARDAFVGRRTALGPEWVAHQAAEWSGRRLHDFVIDLVHQLIRRSQRIAMKKARYREATGRLWIPTCVYEREGMLVRTSAEGGGDVGLRLDQLGVILAAMGLFEREDRVWHPATRAGG